MGKPSERELRSELAGLRVSDGVAPAFDSLRVEWCDAADAPDGRKGGMAWDPPAGDDDAAVLTYDVWEAQRETLDALADPSLDIVAFLAGYGAGKSMLGARWIIRQALENPGSRFLVMGQSFAEARDTTFSKFFEELPGERTALRTSGHNGPESSPIVRDYNRTERRVTFVNDAVAVLGSADKYSRFAGAEFGGVLLDECALYGDELHDIVGMMTTRLRGVDGPQTQLWTTTGDGYNAAYDILERQKDADGEDIGLNIEIVTASSLNNPYLPPEAKESFRRRYEGTGQEQQALHGGFAAATGLVYSSFSRDTHVLDHDDAVDITEDGWRVYGYDAGWRDPRVLIEIGKTPTDQLVVLGEFYERETPVDDALAWLADRPRGRIYAEHAPGDIQRFRDAGHDVEKAEKAIDDGINQVRERLSTDADGEPGLLVSDACTNLIQEFLSYQEEQIGTAGATDHALDSLRYACAGEVSGRPDPGGVVIELDDTTTEPTHQRSGRGHATTDDDLWI